MRIDIIGDKCKIIKRRLSWELMTTRRGSRRQGERPGRRGERGNGLDEETGFKAMGSHRH